MTTDAVRMAAANIALDYRQDIQNTPVKLPVDHGQNNLNIAPKDSVSTDSLSLRPEWAVPLSAATNRTAHGGAPYKAKLQLSQQGGHRTPASEVTPSINADIRTQPFTVPPLKPGKTWPGLVEAFEKHPFFSHLAISKEAEARRYHLTSSSEITDALISALEVIRPTGFGSWLSTYDLPNAKALRAQLLLNDGQSIGAVEHFDVPEELANRAEKTIRALSDEDFTTILNEISGSGDFSIRPGSNTRGLVESIINAARNSATVSLNLDMLGQMKPIQFGTFRLNSTEISTADHHRIYTKDNTVHAQVAEHVIAQPDSPRAMASAAALIDQAMKEANDTPSRHSTLEQWARVFHNPNQHKIVGLIPTRVIYAQNDLLATQLMPQLRELRTFAQGIDEAWLRNAQNDWVTLPEERPTYIYDGTPVKRYWFGSNDIPDLIDLVDKIDAAKARIPLNALPSHTPESPAGTPPLYTGPVALVK